ncbi:carbohydrate ABC transporter permease [Actinoplanes sp. NPDC026619]|uniref:carbohydrate ABC transporter permease n=1 Tax=Actinoplanes sp. NPDC026619 TaxID=3155798 RepID=UPI00340CEFDD
MAAARRYVLLSLFAIPWIVLPLWLLVVNSVKTEGDASLLSIGLPAHFNGGANYATVLHQGRYLVGLGNSLLMAVPSIVIVLLLGSMAAWAYARSPRRSLRVTYYVSVLSVVLPPAIIPTVYTLTQLGLNGSRAGYLLTIVGTRLGMVIFLCTGFVRSLPTDWEEAAQLDGAGRWQVYRRIVLPLLSPALFTGAVLLVINVWNDFFFALFLLQGPGRVTLPLTLYQFASSSAYGLRWNLVFAHVILTSLPLLVAYVILQRRVLAGLTEGGTTG